MLDFKIKSRVHDYEVFFIDNSTEKLSIEIREGDVVLLDKKIKQLHPKVFKAIPKENLIIEINAHEKQKSYEGLKIVISELIKSGFRKNNRLIGLGGGITQDITAFTASIMYRGVDWIFFPTTLLAQGDSCIGSKTSINFGDFKNQLGGFYPPVKIFIDLNFLKTLSNRDFESGLGEMCHYFIVAGKKEFINYKNTYKDVHRDKSILKRIISDSLNIKRKYIEIDEYDTKERQVFNYGHSFGHAIESLTNYSIPHGIAVSFGMDIANFISIKMGMLKASVRIEIRELLEQIWQGYSIKNLDVNKFCEALAKDKKNVGIELRLILCKDYGEVYKMPVKNDKNFKNWLAEYIKHETS